MAKRKSFCCQRCGLPCTIYKKGKGHRVLVCPTCGVLATNPISLDKGIVGKVARTARTLPFGETVGTGLEELGIIKPMAGGVLPSPTPSAGGRLSQFERALALEAIERKRCC